LLTPLVSSEVLFCDLKNELSLNPDPDPDPVPVPAPAGFEIVKSATTLLQCRLPGRVSKNKSAAEPKMHIRIAEFCREQNFTAKGAITSKIKHAVKHKTSPARLAQLLQPSVAFCFSLQAMRAYRPKQNANEGCNSCTSLAGLVFMFNACFILLVIAP